VIETWTPTGSSTFPGARRRGRSRTPAGRSRPYRRTSSTGSSSKRPGRRCSGAGDGSKIFDLPLEALREVLDLNFVGTVLPCQIFGEAMTRGEEGVIVNVSSMAASRPLTKVVGYSAAKSAVQNFTQWLAVEHARKHGAGLRVNAIAPGFFLGELNRVMLVEEDGSLTDRGRTVRRAGGTGGDPDLAVLTRRKVRDRHSGAGGRWFRRLRRGLICARQTPNSS
jgi:NAD(P)-dependent dehydrogenase (short-subunit alcohol dehydrogenase family)